MANGEKRLIPEDRMEKRKVTKRRQTGTTAKDDIEVNLHPCFVSLSSRGSLKEF